MDDRCGGAKRIAGWASVVDFVHAEYTVYFWPLVELSRRLFLGGFVLLIAAERILMRTVMGLLVSFLYVVLLVLLHPHKRLDDHVHALM